MIIKNVTFRFCLLLCIVVCAQVQASAKTIATVSPIGYSLTEAMVKDTPLSVAYLPPARLPVNRIASWIQKHRSDTFEAYDAVVNISAVFEGLDIYPSLRQSNIRIVNIDIAQAIMPNGEKVVLDSHNEYFWLNTNNLLVMSGILKRDLVTLWPGYAEQINQNYQQLTQTLRRINLQVDQLLMDNDIALIVPDNSKLVPFVASISSDVAEADFAQELGLPFVTLATRRSSESGSVWVIDDLSRLQKQPLSQRLQGQVDALETLLK